MMGRAGAEDKHATVGGCEIKRRMSRKKERAPPRHRHTGTDGEPRVEGVVGGWGWKGVWGGNREGLSFVGDRTKLL